MQAGAVVPHIGCVLQTPLNRGRTAWAACRPACAVASATRFCVKVYDAGEHASGFAAAAAEAAASRRATAAGVPTPAHVALVSDGPVVYSVFEWLDGCMTIADFYGAETERWEDVPANVRSGVEDVLNAMYDCGIVYADRSAYNFVVTKAGDIAVVDFEHATMRNERIPDTEREYTWNLDFA